MSKHLTEKDERASCGEVFYGWAPKGQWHMDYSVPRVCDLPSGHTGSHDWIGPSSSTPEGESDG